MREPIRDTVEFQANQQLCQVTGDDVFLTVSEFVRERLRWTGTKTACEEGDCGSCTVLVGRPSAQGMLYRPVNSCIRFVFQLDGCHLVTIEGLAADGNLTAVQQAMIDCHGSQCGFCTPGMIMAATDLLAQNPNPTDDEIRHGLEGNLCRCTGYHNIVRAVQYAAAKMRGEQVTSPNA